MSGTKIDHDRLFKELISTFFEEFMIAFFSEAYEQIDFSHTTFLSEELYTDIIQGEKRRVDLLVETRLKGEDALIIVHIEPQSYVQVNFHERMFIYFSRLYEKYRKRIVPIAIFSYNKVKEEPDMFTISFPFLDVVTFQFLTLELKKKNWKQYIQSNNPVAAALLSKMGYKKEEKVQVKKEFLRMLVRMELDPARMELITGFFESYLKLNEEEEKQLRKEINKLSDDEEARIMQITTSWHDRGREEGRKEGEKMAMLQVARDMLKKGLDLETISTITKLTQTEIEQLRN